MKLLIVGAGGHGRVVADCAAAGSTYSEIAFLDDRHPQEAISGPWPIVGRLDELAQLATRFDACVIALGKAQQRLAMIDAAVCAGLDVPTLVHPAAVLSRHAHLEQGVVMLAGAIVNFGARLGRGCIVNTAGTVDHDCELADGVHVCPGAHLAGDVRVGLRTWFGIGAVARQGLRIGADVTVGAGAVCVRDVPDGTTVAGVPAREFLK